MVNNKKIYICKNFKTYFVVIYMFFCKPVTAMKVWLFKTLLFSTAAGCDLWYLREWRARVRGLGLQKVVELPTGAFSPPDNGIEPEAFLPLSPPWKIPQRMANNVKIISSWWIFLASFGSCKVIIAVGHFAGWFILQTKIISNISKKIRS